MVLLCLHDSAAFQDIEAILTLQPDQSDALKKKDQLLSKLGTCEAPPAAAAPAFPKSTSNSNGSLWENQAVTIPIQDCSSCDVSDDESEEEEYLTPREPVAGIENGHVGLVAASGAPVAAAVGLATGEERVPSSNSLGTVERQQSCTSSSSSNINPSSNTIDTSGGSSTSSRSTGMREAPLDRYQGAANRGYVQGNGVAGKGRGASVAAADSQAGVPQCKPSAESELPACGISVAAASGPAAARMSVGHSSASSLPDPAATAAKLEVTAAAAEAAAVEEAKPEVAIAAAEAPTVKAAKPGVTIAAAQAAKAAKPEVTVPEAEATAEEAVKQGNAAAAAVAEPAGPRMTEVLLSAKIKEHQEAGNAAFKGRKLGKGVVLGWGAGLGGVLCVWGGGVGKGGERERWGASPWVCLALSCRDANMQRRFLRMT
jgi:hypothetical protein